MPFWARESPPEGFWWGPYDWDGAWGAERLSALTESLKGANGREPDRMRVRERWEALRRTTEALAKISNRATWIREVCRVLHARQRYHVGRRCRACRLGEVRGSGVPLPPPLEGFGACEGCVVEYLKVHPQADYSPWQVPEWGRPKAAWQVL